MLGGLPEGSFCIVRQVYQDWISSVDAMGHVSMIHTIPLLGDQDYHRTCMFWRF